MQSEEEWPTVDRAIESALTFTDGKSVAELSLLFASCAMPYTESQVREAVAQMADEGRVHWCGRVWRQKRQRTEQEGIAV